MPPNRASLFSLWLYTHDINMALWNELAQYYVLCSIFGFTLGYKIGSLIVGGW